MAQERAELGKTSYSEYKEAGRLSTILSFTVPSVEIFEVIGKSGRYLAEPVDRDKWLPHLVELSRVAQDTQNILGTKTGLYPEGQIVNGIYTYDTPPQESKVEQRRYKSLTLGHPSSVTRRLFPKSEWLFDISEKIAPGVISTKEGVKNPRLGSPETLAEIVHSFFSDKTSPNGRMFVEAHLGYPIVFCDEKSDLEVFRPHERISLPQDVQGLSFVSTGLRRTRPSGRIIGTPLVICLSSCRRPIARQLLISQLLWKRAVKDDNLSPIFVSKNSELLRTKGLKSEEVESLIDDELDRRAKDKALALLVREPRQIGSNWLESDDIQRVINNVGRELWIPIDKDNGLINMYMGDWLSEGEIMDPRRTTMKEIEEHFIKKLEGAIELLSEWPYAFPSRENQLIVAKYMANFSLPQWKEAREAFIYWSGRLKYLSSLGIPRSPRI